MANDNLVKQIQKAVKEEIRPVKELVEVLKSKVDHIDMAQTLTVSQTRSIKEQQSVINEKLDQHSGALVDIESKIGAYGDMYKINDGNIRKMEKRLEILEEDAGVDVPPELQLAEVV